MALGGGVKPLLSVGSGIAGGGGGAQHTVRVKTVLSCPYVHSSLHLSTSASRFFVEPLLSLGSGTGGWG